MKRTAVKLFAQMPDDDGELIELLTTTERSAQVTLEGNVLALEDHGRTWRQIGRVDADTVPRFMEHATEDWL